MPSLCNRKRKIISLILASDALAALLWCFCSFSNTAFSTRIWFVVHCSSLRNRYLACSHLTLSICSFYSTFQMWLECCAVSGLPFQTLYPVSQLVHDSLFLFSFCSRCLVWCHQLLKCSRHIVLQEQRHLWYSCWWWLLWRPFIRKETSGLELLSQQSFIGASHNVQPSRAKGWNQAVDLGLVVIGFAQFVHRALSCRVVQSWSPECC